MNTSAGQTLSPDDNPYASPTSSGGFEFRPQATAEDGPWRLGKLLVLRRDAGLIDRCLECGEPTAGSGYVARYQWAPGFFAWRYEHAQITLPTCPRHHWRYRRRQPILLTAQIGALAVFGILALVILPPPVVPVAFMILLPLPAIFAERAMRVLLLRPSIMPAEIDNVFVCLRNVPAQYLGGLPEFHGRLAHRLRYPRMNTEASLPE